MTDQDYIRKAFELADGCEIQHERDGIVWITCPWWSGKISQMPQWAKDALAAQLVRQVDALKPAVQVNISCFSAEVYSWGEEPTLNLQDDGRTMNTIKAIVDSKVLE